MKTIFTLLFIIFSLTAIAQPQQPWSWKFPLPQGNDIYDIQFTSKDTGYAIASVGNF